MSRYFVIALLLITVSPGGVLAATQDPGSSPNTQAQPPAAPPDAQEPPAEQKSSGDAPAQKEAEPSAAQPETNQPSTKTAKKDDTSGKAAVKKPAKKPTAQPDTEQPHKVVVHQGSIGEPKAQLSPGMSAEQANHQRRNANQLLASTESNLQRLSGRSLNATQQDTVGQIRNYMGQARTALDKGDPQRARNLAFKAHLLSDDLVKH
jgi:hypothetical protein